MKRLEISGAISYHLSENEKQQLEDALGILTRMITRAVLEERWLVETSRREESPDPAIRHYKVAAPRSPDEPLALSVQATAKILGLSRGSAYEAVRTGQIPSIRFGSRILVPRSALERMISQADGRESDDRRRS